jgi:MDMPI C-terminal domain
VDAELTAGLAVSIPSYLAADCISDLLETFTVLPTIDDFPRLAELCRDGATLHFHATDQGLGAEGEWLVRRGESGLQWEHGHDHADVAVRGPAAELLQVLTHRAAPDRVEVLGDDKLFARWLENAVF